MASERQELMEEIRKKRLVKLREGWRYTKPKKKGKEEDWEGEKIYFVYLSHCRKSPVVFLSKSSQQAGKEAREKLLQILWRALKEGRLKKDQEGKFVYIK